LDFKISGRQDESKLNKTVAAVAAALWAVFSSVTRRRRGEPATGRWLQHLLIRSQAFLRWIYVLIFLTWAKTICVPSSCKHISLPLTLFMSLAEIEKAVDELSPNELTKLAAYIVRRDKLAWDKELEEDFSPGGKHEKALERIDAEIDAGNFTPLP
jgi:hypothetical protein